MPVFVLNSYQYISTFWKLQFLSLQNFHCIFVWCHAHCIPKGVGVEGRGQDITCAWIWEALRVKLTHSLVFDLFLFLTLYQCMCWFSLFKKSQSHLRRRSLNWEDDAIRLVCGRVCGSFSLLLIDVGGPVHCGRCHLGRWSELVWQSKPRAM